MANQGFAATVGNTQAFPDAPIVHTVSVSAEFNLKPDHAARLVEIALRRQPGLATLLWNVKNPDEERVIAVQNRLLATALVAILDAAIDLRTAGDGE